MLLVTNVSKKEISISDLGINISPKQAFDLDALSLKNSPISSQDLKQCIKKGWIKVIKNSHKKKRKDVQKIEKTVTQKIPLDDIRKVIRDEMQGISAGVNNQQLSQILTSMAQMIQSGQTMNKENAHKIAEQPESEFSNIDEKTLMEIHARSVERLTDGVEGVIEYKKEEVETNITENISELEDLIG